MINVFCIGFAQPWVGFAGSYFYPSGFGLKEAIGECCEFCTFLVIYEWLLVNGCGFKSILRVFLITIGKGSLLLLFNIFIYILIQ